MTQGTLIILGSGYVARFMLPPTDFYSDIQHTSRDPNKNLVWLPPDRRIRFNLAQPETWKNISSGTDLLWCFPAVPLDSVRRFAAQFQTCWKRLVVLGSTSAYDLTESPDYPPPWIDESASVDLNKPRVQGEEFLRRECGAIVLRVAGIYGPNRNPIDWIRTGRVAPSPKYVNLIHVEDLASACLAALTRGVAGEVYNVSDGTPRTWEDICRHSPEHWKVAQIPGKGEATPGKRIANAKLLSLLATAGLSIRHTDLYRSLEAIQEER